MLLLVTILLVVVAAVTLLIGIVSDQLVFIFISIGASFLAAVVLAVLSQMSRKKSRAAVSEDKAPEPLPARKDAAKDADAADAVGEDDKTAQQAAVSIEEIGEPVVRADDADVAATTGALPIADYDSLRVNEILPRLDDLDLDELEAVAQHEESRKNRTTILNRVDALMDQLEAAEGTAPVPAASDDLAEQAVASIEEIGEPVVAVEAPADAEGDDADEAPPADETPLDAGFPIPNYDALDEDEVIPLLADLDADQLETVADREEAGANRDAVLDAIDDRLDILEGIVPAPAAADSLPVEAAVPAPAGPAKKAAAKKSVAKKAAAKKAPARKAAAAPVSLSGPVTTAARKAPVKTAKKTLAPVEKAPAATAKRTAKAAPAKAAAATPAKRAVKAAPAAKKTASGSTSMMKKAAPKKAAAAKKATKR